MPVQAIVLFIIALVLLIKGGDWFVNGSVGISHRLGVPEILIGATVVSIGTTLPEVMVSATSAIEGHGQIAYGNAIGSIICNTALISAITIAIKPAATDRRALKIPLIFFFSTAALFTVSAYAFREFSRITGIVFLLAFAVYITLSVRSAKALSKTADKDEKEEQKGTLFSDIMWLVIGAALIAVGARLLVDNGTLIAAWLGVPESVIGLTFVALGTSLPELVTAIAALTKGHGALSLGNIIGANLFNIVLVTGASSALSPFKLPADKLIYGVPVSLCVDIPVMFGVMIILTLPALIKNKLYRTQGIALLLIYAAFCTFQFVF